MRYIMMDTNILLDMIVDRRNNVSVGLMEAFIKLLEYDEIKLIIPAIVVHETNKHIEEQLNLVGNKIFNAKKSLKAMCGINGYKTEGFDIETEKKELLLKINELYEKYNLNKEVYLTNIRVTIEKIFNHDNCVIVQDTEQLRNLCLQRRIYKRAPFHYKKKESFADGLITEILIHYWEDEEVSLDENDDIIFVTGNTKDFSKCDENSILHDDIREDLEKVGLLEKVTYINSFSELIGKELRQEIDNANLEEEFEKELQEQEELDEEQLYADVLDMDREAVGLSSLSCYEDKFIDDFYESEFKEKLCKLFERLDSSFRKLEEIESFYDDDLYNYISTVDIESITMFAKKWNEFGNELEEIPEIIDIFGIKEIFEWVEEKRNANDYSYESKYLPDDIQYGDTITFYDVEKKKYEIKMENLNLSPSNGETEWVNIAIYQNNEICVNGRFEITYGNIGYDEDGNIGDACEDGILYYTEEIKDYIDKIVNEFEQYIGKEERIINDFKEIFEI